MRLPVAPSRARSAQRSHVNPSRGRWRAIRGLLFDVSRGYDRRKILTLPAVIGGVAVGPYRGPGEAARMTKALVAASWCVACTLQGAALAQSRGCADHPIEMMVPAGGPTIAGCLRHQLLGI